MNYCKQTPVLETAEIMQDLFDYCNLLRRMNYCTNIATENHYGTHISCGIHPFSRLPTIVVDYCRNQILSDPEKCIQN